MPTVDSAERLIGSITCSDMIEQPDGSWKVIFDYDEKFKDEYKKLFNLKRWSKKHFQETLDKAIANLAKKIEADAAKLKEQ